MSRQAENEGCWSINNIWDRDYQFELMTLFLAFKLLERSTICGVKSEGARLIVKITYLQCKFQNNVRETAKKGVKCFNTLIAAIFYDLPMGFLCCFSCAFFRMSTSWTKNGNWRYNIIISDANFECRQRSQDWEKLWSIYVYMFAEILFMFNLSELLFIFALELKIFCDELSWI